MNWRLVCVPDKFFFKTTKLNKSNTAPGDLVRGPSIGVGILKSLFIF